MPLRVLGPRILVERSQSEEKKGNLFLTTNEIKNQGTVLDVGEDVDSIHCGDVVLFDKYSGQEIEIEEKKLLILNKDHILGILS